MLEIPGEEAPTDPGAQMRIRLAAEERIREKSRRSRRIAAGALGAMAMVGVAIAGTAWFQAREAALTYDLPDDYYQATPLEQVAAAPTPESAQKASSAPKTEKATEKATAKAQPEAGQTGATRPGTEATVAPEAVAARPRNDADAIAPQISLKSGDNGIPSLGATNVAPGFNKMLSDDAEIFEMAKSVVEKYRPQLNACFESATRAAPDLRGSWTVSFTIEPGGTTKNVSVKPTGRQDESFERCAAKSVASWKFLKIDHDFNVRKKYNFDPQG